MFFIPEYILILIFTIIIDYFAGILIHNVQNRKLKKRWLIVSLITNIGILAVFKYYNFFGANINELAEKIGWNYNVPLLEIVLPIGLSFHTFQAMSYTIEVYRGKQLPERHFGIYALYVMYYPQLVAGPIERPQNLLWQFHKKHYFEYDRVTDGLKQMAFGLFKKVVIADRLSSYVNPVYDAPDTSSPMSVFMATVFFSIQIFCDFSGYSDIAIGASRVMGIDLMTNFRRPYFSTSISEFWKRWHISLSTWFKDYLYIPLGGNRGGKWRTTRNMVITFLVSGLWHGANWTFIIWGGLHSVYLVFAMLTEKIRAGLRKITGISRFKIVDHLVQSALVFFLAAFAWIFFRAKTVADGFVLAKKFLIAIPNYLYNFFTNPKFLWLEELIFRRTFRYVWFDLAILAIAIFMMFLFHRKQEQGSTAVWLRNKNFVVRWSIYFVVIMSIILFGVYHDDNEFIYFQF